MAQEEVSVGKREVETGRVRVRTHVDEERLNLSELLEHDVVDVDRVPVNAEVEVAPAPFEEDGVLVVPVVEERLVVEKRLVVVEELRIRRRHVQERVELPVTRRVMRAEVERADADPRSSANLGPQPDRPVGSAPSQGPGPRRPMMDPELGANQRVSIAAEHSATANPTGSDRNEPAKPINWTVWILGGLALLALLLGIARWNQLQSASEPDGTALSGATAVAEGRAPTYSL